MSNVVKSLMVRSVCAASLLFCGAAMAATNPPDNWYVGASGDLSWMRNSDTGGGGNVDLGYRFWPSNFGDFRLEAEGGYHGAGGSGDYSGTHYFSYMGNLYYDFNSAFSDSSGSHIIPYIGGGMGDATVHYGNGGLSTTFNHHTSEFAYEGMAGLTLVTDTMPHTDWSLGYRYLGTDKTNIDSNSLELGFRYHF